MNGAIPLLEMIRRLEDGDDFNGATREGLTCPFQLAYDRHSWGGGVRRATSSPVRTWQLVPSLLYLIPFAAIAWYCHWAQHDRLRDVILAITWAVALTLLSGPLVEIAARSPLPLADRSLARIDLIQTAAVVNWLRRSSRLTFLSAVAYWVLLPLLVAAIVLPPLCSYRKAMQRFIVSGTVASLLTASIFAIWPAIGPWTVEGYQASQEQELTSTALLMLRAHHSDHSRPPTDAFVSFPSFHTILAILSLSRCGTFAKRGGWDWPCA